MKYVKIDSYHNENVTEGVIYCTYSSLIGRTALSGAKYRTRLEKLLEWCGKDFDGPVSFLYPTWRRSSFLSLSLSLFFSFMESIPELMNLQIIFDESHRAKNLCPGKSQKATKTGKFVLNLQKELPNARVVYVSATGASEMKNMAYMTRLGMWGLGTPFGNFSAFLKTIEKRYELFYFLTSLNKKLLVKKFAGKSCIKKRKKLIW